MQSYPVSEMKSRPQADENTRLTWFNSDLECSFGRWVVIHSRVEKEDPDMSGYVFDDSLLFASFVDEKDSGTR